jgi:hypothetical protein
MNLSFRVGDKEENVQKNRELFFGELGINLKSLAIPRQVHSDKVCRVDAPGEYESSDGLMTDVAGVFLCITVADCVPVILIDPVHRVVAAVHAGWRGTWMKIVKRAVEKMNELFGVTACDLMAYLGPAAGSCCYEVGEEIALKFTGPVLNRTEGRIYLDLKLANVFQLEEAGIMREQIEVSNDCTISDATRYHSFRRDGQRSGRMMAVVGILTA